MKTTYLGLGSNIGDKEKNMLKAIALINTKFIILDYSSIYITSPVGYREQPYFLNMVIKIDSEGTTPYELLKFIKFSELEVGRKKIFRWGPRSIDIDILYIDGIKIESENLFIPHKELLKRNFVLIPLSEIAEYITVDTKPIFIKEFINYNSLSTDSVILYKSKEDIVLNE